MNDLKDRFSLCVGSESKLLHHLKRIVSQNFKGTFGIKIDDLPREDTRIAVAPTTILVVAFTILVSFFLVALMAKAFFFVASVIFHFLYDKPFGLGILCKQVFAHCWFSLGCFLVCELKKDKAEALSIV
jgi:hypothetical protein